MKFRTDRLVSAFENHMDWDKVEKYSEDMIKMDYEIGCVDFPPIKGYKCIITEEDIGKNFIRDIYDIEDSLISEKHLGEEIWMVTDGHHRSFAIRKAKSQSGVSLFDYIEVEKDYSTITNQKELEEW